MLDIVVKRLHDEVGNFYSVTTGYFTRYLAQGVDGRLVAARSVASTFVDAFGATQYFAHLRSSFGCTKILSSRGRRSP
jgi:hypothetical protein